MGAQATVCYLNGEFLPLDEARVPVMDRGFLFGDGVYEVIPVYGGRLFRLREHLRRLRDSLEGVRVGEPMSDAAWESVLREIVTRNGDGDQSVYLQVTRGTAPVRDHAFPEGVAPTVFVMSSPLKPVPQKVLDAGVSAVTLDDIRWNLCNIKAITLLPNVLLRQQAIDGGCAEAILIRNGQAVEGAASNLFVVHEGVVVTPPKSPLLLPGITRDLVLELAQANGIANREAPISGPMLRAASELWFTSSTKEILPVTRLDGQQVGEGRPGPVWTRMIALYQGYKQALREGRAA